MYKKRCYYTKIEESSPSKKDELFLEKFHSMEMNVYCHLRNTGQTTQRKNLFGRWTRKLQERIENKRIIKDDFVVVEDSDKLDDQQRSDHGIFHLQ